MTQIGISLDGINLKSLKNSLSLLKNLALLKYYPTNSTGRIKPHDRSYSVLTVSAWGIICGRAFSNYYIQTGLVSIPNIVPSQSNTPQTRRIKLLFSIVKINVLWSVNLNHSSLTLVVTILTLQIARHISLFVTGIQAQCGVKYNGWSLVKNKVLGIHLVLILFRTQRRHHHRSRFTLPRVGGIPSSILPQRSLRSGTTQPTTHHSYSKIDILFWWRMTMSQRTTQTTITW